jgi:PTH1 family peptidyl-tRNA hydrolase
LVCFALGNPGKKYVQTRHNIGFMVADALAQEFGTKFKSGNDYQWLSKEIDEKEIIIVKPLLYMNNSGIIVKEYLAENQDDFIVVCDDFALPLGRIRIREHGSDGGQQGLASIIYHLATNNFPRLRIGIGTPSPELPHSEYVLSKFTNQEKKLLPETIQRSGEALICIFKFGIKKAMNLYNLNPNTNESSPS